MPSMADPAVKPDHRRALWNTMLTAEMNACYWGWISDRYTKMDTYLKFLLAITASGAVAGWKLWVDYPSVWKSLSAVSAIAALAQPIFFSSEKLKRMSALVATWKEMSTNYELLWEKDECLGTTESWGEFETAKRREGNIDETNLPKNDRLIKKAYQHVVRKRSYSNVGQETAQTITTYTATTGR